MVGTGGDGHIVAVAVVGIVAMDELQSFYTFDIFFYLSSFWSNGWKQKIIHSWVTYYRASASYQLSPIKFGVVFSFLFFSFTNFEM